MYCLVYLLTALICSAYSQLQDCGGILRATELELKSPGYPGILRPGVSCEWNIQSVSNKFCKLEVEFIVADLHDASLIIAGVPHTGSVAGLRTYFFSNNTNISFRNGNSPSKGFNIIIKQKICDESPTTCGSILNTKDIILNGPPPNSQECNFIVKQFSKDACKIVINFDKFFLANSKDCVMGGLEIGEDVLCGSVDGHRKYDLVNGEIKIKFYTKRITLRDKFSLKVTQLICNNNPEVSDKLEDFNVTQSNTKESFLNNLPSFNSYNYGSCCNQIHSERQFFLASPGFPNSNNIDCTYTIRRNSPDTQYLKMVFKYFWIGDKDEYYNSCNRGFLQIDGYTFCGCQTGVVWVTQFNFYDYSEFKTLRLFINQANRNRFTGFVIEIIQCQYIDPPPNRFVRHLRTEISNQNKNTYYENTTDTERSFTPIKSKDFETVAINITQKTNNNLNNRQARYQSHENFIIPTDFYCLSWNIKDWIVLLQQAVWAQLHCPLNGPNRISKLSLPLSSNHTETPTVKKCNDVKDNHGLILLSGENYFETQEENCFRFIPIPGNCILEVVFNGIDIPWSFDCNYSNAFISSVGNICPIANYKTVQASIEEEPIVIKIKNIERKTTKAYLEYRQMACH